VDRLDAIRDILDAIDVTHGGAAIFLDDSGHGKLLMLERQVVTIVSEWTQNPLAHARGYDELKLSH
jgi:hypothetical protein